MFGAIIAPVGGEHLNGLARAVVADIFKPGGVGDTGFHRDITLAIEIICDEGNLQIWTKGTAILFDQMVNVEAALFFAAAHFTCRVSVIIHSRLGLYATHRQQDQSDGKQSAYRTGQTADRGLTVFIRITT